jgi:ribonuclease R
MDSTRHRLDHLLDQETYQPLNADGLARRLKVPAPSREGFDRLLRELEEEGCVTLIRGNLYVRPLRVGMVAGRIQMNERGFGFVLAEDWDGADVYVAAEDTHVAMHGDRVLVRLEQAGRRGRRGSDKDRPSGKVVRVLRRARACIVGRLEKTDRFWYVVPDEIRIPHDIYVPAPKPPVPAGHKVVAKLADWPSRHVNPEGEIVEVLGPPDQPGVDMLSIIRKYDLPEEFPDAVEAEARSIPTALDAGEVSRRDDFRQHYVVTIDPDDAKDFDDALSFVKGVNGEIEVYIHIADVSHYIRPGSPMDREAQRRGNSTYLVDRVLPMLPEKLSNGICSLKPNVDRFVKTVAVRLGPKGEIRNVRFARGVIHSRERLTYRQALQILRKPAKGPLGQTLHTLHSLAQTLRKRRFAEGALDLEFPEVKVRLDETGKPLRLEVNANDESHQLIEEFMLLANEVVARHLKQRQIPSVYRIHENPDPGKLQELRVQLQAHGLKAGDLNQRREMQAVLRKAAGHPLEHVIKIQLLRSLSRARYASRPLGHYGLAKTHYTHFTSPIRRYADLLVHRSLFDKQGSLPIDELERVAASISNAERTSADAEFDSRKLKIMELFARDLAMAKPRRYSALVIEVRSFGVVIELPATAVQGAVAMGDLEGDVYSYDFHDGAARGLKSKRRLRPGDSLKVAVKAVDFVKKQIRFTGQPAVAKISKKGKLIE